MKVLVTGGAGFIGFNVAQELNSEGHDVIILDNKIDGKNELNWMMAEQYGIERMHCSINHLLPRGTIFGDIDAIVHCAAQTAVTKSLENPLHDFITNVRGTFNVCEFAREHDAKIIYTGTNKVYGDNVNKISLKEGKTRYRYGSEKYCIDELFPIDHTAHSPYGVSKLAADLYIQEYHHTYGLDTVVFRMSCIYGTGQVGSEDQGWIAHMVHQWVNGGRINIFGDGKQVRDALHVDDLVSLLSQTVEGNASGVFNIGGGLENTISILELINMLDEWEPHDRNILWHPWRQADQKVYISNISKANKILGFSPTISPKKGIRRLFNRGILMRDSVRIK